MKGDRDLTDTVAAEMFRRVLLSLPGIISVFMGAAFFGLFLWNSHQQSMRLTDEKVERYLGQVTIDQWKCYLAYMRHGDPRESAEIRDLKDPFSRIPYGIIPIDEDNDVDFVFVSTGPDRSFDHSTDPFDVTLYDPTNGAVSGGDILFEIPPDPSTRAAIQFRLTDRK